MTADFLRFVAAFVFAAALFVADWRADALDPVRAALSVTLAPFRATAAAPRAISEAAADYLRARATLAEEKRAREEEFRGLSARLQSLDSLAAQNRRLRALLRLREITDGDFAAAEIMAGARQSFTGLVVIDRGAQGGARAGAGVIDVGGVFGQVVQVDADTSLIRQVTDINHQVAARCRRNGLFAVLRGDGGDGIEAQFLPADADVRAGDVFVAASGAYPVGYPIAEVESARAEGDYLRVVARPLSRLAANEAVLIFLPAAESDSDSDSDPAADPAAAVADES